MEREGEEKRIPRLNLRIAVFCALALAFGIFLCGGILFHLLSPAGIVLFGGIFVLALFPLSKRRTILLVLCLVLFGGAGALLTFLKSESYLHETDLSGVLEGRAVSVSVKRGYSVVVLDSLVLDGKDLGGKCRLILGEGPLPADLLRLNVTLEVENPSEGDYALSCYAQGIRYTGSPRAAMVVGRSKNPFLLLNRALFERLHAHMEEDEADLAYALLTGGSGSIDEGLSSVVRKGGIAHIFAVSGLHIGILYAAVQLASKKLGRWRFVPAAVLALLYSGVCGFSVSSLRAVIVCGALGATRAFGKKEDFFNALGLAAIAVLLLFPEEWYAAGMRLSFGACIGLFLFGGSLRRMFTRLRFPGFLSTYLSSSLAVWLFTAPILIDSFGFLSVWGFLLNLFLIPVLPVFFLCALLCGLCAVIIPPAAGFFLLFPSGIFSVLLFVLSADYSFVISGFSLGAGSAVCFAAACLLSERFRLRPLCKGIAAGGLAVLLVLSALFENVVFSGCRIDTYRSRDDCAVLVRTPTKSVLLIDGEIGLGACEEFLLHTYGGTLDAVVVLAEEELDGVNEAAFLKTDTVRVRDEIVTGLSSRKVLFGESFTIGELSFRYETRDTLYLIAEGVAVAVDFGGKIPPGCDLFLDGARGGLKYFLKDGIIKTV